MPSRLEGRTAIVTGAGRPGGIGEAIALRLAGDGADIALVDVCRSADTGWSEGFGQWEGLQAVEEKVKALGRRALSLKADLTVESEVEEMVETVMQAFGRIDILCNNASGGRGAGPIEVVEVVDITLDDWRYTIDASLTTTFLCSKHVARRMIAAGRGGAIVNMSSGAARRPTPGNSGYTCAKMAVNGLTQCLAVELAAKNIRVNAVSPGITDTPWVQQRLSYMAKTQGLSDEAMFEQWTSRAPIKRAASPDEQAAVVAFLASDDASYVTGQTVGVDGGLAPV